MSDASAFEGDEVALLSPELQSGTEALPAGLCVKIHRLMVRAHPRRAHDQDVQVWSRLFLDRRPG